jgi:hypothetical protein
MYLSPKVIKNAKVLEKDVDIKNIGSIVPLPNHYISDSLKGGGRRFSPAFFYASRKSESSGPPSAIQSIKMHAFPVFFSLCLKQNKSPLP